MTSSSDKPFVIAVAAAAAMSALFFLCYTLHLSNAASIMRGNDFQVFYGAAQKLAAGNAQTLYSPEATREYVEKLQAPAFAEIPFVYPPPMLLFVRPLQFFSYDAAAMAWMAAQIALLALAIAGLKPRPVMFALALPFVAIGFLSGQTGMLASALLIAGAGHMERRPGFSGICLGLLLIKPQLALLIPVALIAARRWRVLAVTVITALLLVFITSLLWGWQLWPAFFSVLPEHARLVEKAPNHLTRLMVSAYGFLRLVGVPYALSMAVQLFCAAAAIVAVWNIYRRRQAGPARLALLSAATLLVSPYLFVYDLPLLLPALAWLADKGLTGPLGGNERKLLPLAAFLPIAAVQLNEIHIPLALMTAAGLCAVLYKRKRN